MRVPPLAALLGLLSTTATAAPAAPPAAQRGADSMSPATRFDGGASASFPVSARIIRQSASVGAGRGPPAPLMVARATSVTAADGRVVPALVYDFE
jgi:hypothetical protein